MKWIQTFITAVGGMVGWFCGGFDGFLYALIVFIISDYVTGLIVAAVKHEISSEIGYTGVLKKITILILVGIANVLDTQIIGQGAVLRTAIIFLFLSNEGISILENASVIGIPVPKVLKDKLIQLSKESGGEDE